MCGEVVMDASNCLGKAAHPWWEVMKTRSASVGGRG
ncbi:hypothetical protein X746_10915 [Mesorhizobium sp. LNJC380A00]|nr:hypothetical protein X746_10915 [Mesorhizobium sp. LNJC380A00]